MVRDSGIRTLLMTDVVGSTRRWADHPEAMPAAIERLELIAAEAVCAEGGSVVKSRGEGDSLFCTFATPAHAARAAIRLNLDLSREPWPEGIDLKVRAAIHCGPAHERDGDLFGAMPARCARLREVGHGGQILLSGAARAHIGAGDGIATRELGRHRLRDLDEPETIHQLLAEGLPADFPPLRSLTCLRNNLPIQYTTFIGRDALRRDLLERLRQDRLTTLTGAGGSGKTRLAIQLGADVIDEFPDGVWFAELAEFSSEPTIVRAIAEACGHRDLLDPSALEALGTRLQSQLQTLLVLDNAEHAVPIVARVVSSLIRAAPNLRVVVTSREPLRLRGERVHRVPTLSVPEEGEDDLSRVTITESVELFVDRARLHLPEFSLRNSNARAMGEIARRLDGIPLCLEMAAAHVDYLSVEQIADRLNDRFDFLEQFGADGPPRHRTMRETIAWQYDSLCADEKLLLQRLGVFAGSFEIVAAETVCGESPIGTENVRRHLRTLVDKSLVVATPQDDEMRYRLLETINQFVSEQPEGGREGAKPRLLEWALALASSGNAELYGPDHDRWVARLDGFSPSMISALEWAIACATPMAAKVAASLIRYWHFRGRYGEGMALLMAARRHAASAALKADLTNAIAVFSQRLGDSKTAEELYRELLNGQEVPQNVKVKVLTNLAVLLNEQGDLAESVALYEEAESLAETLGEASNLRITRYNRAVCLVDMGRLNDAERLLTDIIAVCRRENDLKRLARALDALGSLHIGRDEIEQAARCLSDALNATGYEPEAQFFADLLLNVSQIAEHRGMIAESAKLIGAYDRLQTELASVVPRNYRRRERIVQSWQSPMSIEVSIGTTLDRSVVLDICRGCLKL